MAEKGPEGGGKPEGEDVNPPPMGFDSVISLKVAKQLQGGSSSTDFKMEKENLPCHRVSLLPTRSLHR